MKLMKSFFALMLLMFTVVACQNADQSKELLSNEWKVESIKGIETLENVEENSFTMKFMQDENKVVGVASCNNYFAGYTVSNDGSLTFTNPGSTMMMCPNMESEDAYLKLFPTVKSFKINGDKLEFLNEEGVVITFVKK